MLTRLCVSGFKNLVDIDLRFGPFTCVAGANGVGKSNLLDAIVFLSALSERPLTEAALSIRDEGRRTGDVRTLFHRAGDVYASEMTFMAEMLIPDTGVDDLGQEAAATSTYLRYEVCLRYREDESARNFGNLELVREKLEYITKSEARQHLAFPASHAWIESVIKNERRAGPYISTDEKDSKGRVIKVHQDSGSQGRARKLLASKLPRTALSAANAAESPTATLAKREMQSWRRLQLEPSALREPDVFTAPGILSPNGAHLPATLFSLARVPNAYMTPDESEAAVYSEVAGILSQLIDDVRTVRVDRDEKRELLTLYVTDRSGTPYPARALSDGTLRFLALAVLAAGAGGPGLVCMEEPENGIHPQRIAAMIRLLSRLSTDVRIAIGPENPLRQIIINTHSPAVVMAVEDQGLVMARLVDVVRKGVSFRALEARALQGTWREKAGAAALPRGELLGYLNPVVRANGASGEQPPESKRVIDRDDIRQIKIDFSIPA